MVRACAHVKSCVGITLWDFYDPFSWVLATYPGQGAALLWYSDFTKHPAYNGIIETFKHITSHKLKARRRLGWFGGRD